MFFEKFENNDDLRQGAIATHDARCEKETHGTSPSFARIAHRNRPVSRERYLTRPRLRPRPGLQSWLT